MLRATNVTKEYQSGDSKVKALDDVNIEIDQGQFASIVGKSGSGKSTLLALLGALDKPTSGKIEVDGEDITKVPSSGLTKYRRSKIGFVFQGYNLVPNLSAMENVMLPCELMGVSRGERKARATELLEQVGLEGAKQERRPGRLSGGEQQRVAIARALANRPSVILADEPTGNLDSQTGKMIFDLLHSLARTMNTTIVTVTHDMSIAGKTDVTFRLKDGKIVA
ncbi:MAG: ABC transporter ATP-binding protein [Actinomycetota bacterium]|nr:ABC transporter ATP-binding protein [Actinomycetota bacterium]